MNPNVDFLTRQWSALPTYVKYEWFVFIVLSTYIPAQVEISGLTNVIKFDNQGFRTDFELDVVEVNKEGLSKIGTWNASQGINFTRSFVEAYSNIVDNLHNKTLVVTLILVSLDRVLVCAQQSSIIIF